MSESKNEKYMDEIITVDQALDWFSKDPKFESKYRKPISGMESFSNEFYELNTDFYKDKNKYYSTFPSNYDCDSSPKAWEHYIRHYVPSFFGETYNEYSDQNDQPCGKQYYLFEGLMYDGVRICAAPEVYAKNLGAKTFKKERLGGDCDLNFNEAKRPRFAGAIFNKYIQQLQSSGDIITFDIPEKEYSALMLLANCSRMHHTLLNFSLMQGSGNMQGIKQLCDFDRIDEFFVYLDEFYCIDNKEKQKEKLKAKRQSGYKVDENLKALRHYLNTFRVKQEPTESIKNYCSKIYFLPTRKNESEIYQTGKMSQESVDVNDSKYKGRWDKLLEDNANLINALLESGKIEKLTKAEDVVNYMLLAVRFWRAKEEYFTLMDEILADEKKQ